MSKERIKITSDDGIGFALLVLVCLLCAGSPDIIDGIVYQLTDVRVWEVEADD